MLKISLSFFLAIFAFVSLAAAQNSNKAVKTSGAVNKARALTNADVNSGVEPELANSTVRGRVYYEDTGRAVKRASLILVRAEGGPGEASGLTDANGEFVFRKVKAGTYYAMINAPGIVTPLAYLDFSRIQGGEKEAMEEAVLNFEKIVVDGVNELNVQIPAKRGGAVSGRIIYENGDPAIGSGSRCCESCAANSFPFSLTCRPCSECFQVSWATGKRTTGASTGSPDCRPVSISSKQPKAPAIPKATREAREWEDLRPFSAPTRF